MILAVPLFSMFVLPLYASSVSARPANSQAPYTSVPMFRADPAHTGVMAGPAPTAKPVELWQFDTGSFFSASPVTSNGMVFVSGFKSDLHSTSACFLYALDAKSGTVRWQVPGICGITPAVVDNVVYATGVEATATGNLVIGLESPPAIVAALDAETGDEFWRTKLLARLSSAVTVTDHTVFAGGTASNISPGGEENEGVITAIDRETGAVRWQTIVGDGRTGTPDSVDSTPAVSRGVLYTGVDHVGTIALDADTGLELWRAPYGGEFSSPAVAGHHVFISGIDEKVYALDAATGELTWSFTTGDSNFASVAIKEDAIYFPSSSGIFYALDAGTGQVKWQLDDAGGAASPAIVGDTVIAASALGADQPGPGALLGIHIATGQELWKVDIGPTLSSPAISDGKIFAVDFQGILRAFADPPD
jgi:outer membrane protein assembly factor BamB